MPNGLYLTSAVLLLGAAYLIFRVILKRDYRLHFRLSSLSSVLETAIFAAHGVFTYSFLPADWPALHAPLAVWVAGAVISAFGLAFTLLSMSGLGWNRSIGQEVSTLRQTGFYRFSRNPQILSYGLVVSGLALVWPSWYSLGWVAVYGLIAHWMVTTEEEHLLRVYAQEYQNYCARIPRYLGVH